MWGTYVLAWALAVVFVGTIFFGAYWLHMVAAFIAFGVACGGAHHTHEMHLSDRAPRFKVPQSSSSDDDF